MLNFRAQQNYLTSGKLSDDVERKANGGQTNDKIWNDCIKQYFFEKDITAMNGRRRRNERDR